MGCGIAMVKYLLFIFNFIFALLGLLILGVGVWIHVGLNDFDKVTDQIGAPAIAFIIIGVIIFVIAFFGCCGAIRESHCMVITYAVFLLTILVIQIAIGIWAFILSKDVQNTDTQTTITDGYRTNVFNNYWTREEDRDVVDAIQSTLNCCGVTGPNDFNGLTNGNNTIPWSCCGDENTVACSLNAVNLHTIGCADRIADTLNKFTVIIGAVAIGVAVTELIGIIFALCLANSIRNDDRRGYRV